METKQEIIDKYNQIIKAKDAHIQALENQPRGFTIDTEKLRQRMCEALDTPFTAKSVSH